MSQHDYVSNALENLGAALREQPSLKDRVIRNIAEATVQHEPISNALLGSRTIRALMVLAACLLVILSTWQISSQESASKVFAAALDSVRQAKSFSCKRIMETIEDGKKFVEEKLFMFKEPNLERSVVLLSSRFPRLNGEVTIHNYDIRQRLRLVPTEKKAYITDYSFDYVVDEDTGKLKLSELDTSMRDDLLEWSQGEVEDLGEVKLLGQAARLLKSRWGQWDLKMWVAPRTNLPVQVVLQGPNGDLVTFSSIQIDTELDDSLFSLEPPENYRLRKINPGWSKYQRKLSAKMSHLVLACSSYRNEHGKQFPNQLSDLKATGIKEDVLKAILATPEQPDGPVVIRYHRPPADADFASCIILHETFEKWPENGLVACFADGHRSIIHDQKRFKQLLP